MAYVLVGNLQLILALRRYLHYKHKEEKIMKKKLIRKIPVPRMVLMYNVECVQICGANPDVRREYYEKKTESQGKTNQKRFSL